MTAPLNNVNAAKHFTRAALPKLPPQCSHIRKQSSQLRAGLEAALEERSLPVGTYEALVISAICRWQRHGALCARWLRLEGDTLAPADRLRFSEAVAKAGDATVRLAEKIGLDRQDQADIFSTLYGPTTPAIPNPNVDTASQAATSQPPAADAACPEEEPQADG